MDPSPVAGQLDAVDNDAALLVLLQSIDAANESRLARPGRPANDDTLAALHGEVDVVEDVELAVPLVQANNLDCDIKRITR